ncbi:methyltransferase domain-containing protein [Colletotrichum truncatum]|uniref:Methyltransferase domain-containing protein n=1 Tax=Colletotrichum truncatum TaxID=5467 RepID=A0ACC3YYX4_COLTU|nr:methyltransferase domain-containing protein [Colletotrichum truncatum]KAF6781109.1 methyltransferase domain-containing protein [Colletotrichum truncatum]
MEWDDFHPLHYSLIICNAFSRKARGWEESSLRNQKQPPPPLTLLLLLLLLLLRCPRASPGSRAAPKEIMADHFWKTVSQSPPEPQSCSPPATTATATDVDTDVAKEMARPATTMTPARPATATAPENAAIAAAVEYPDYYDDDDGQTIPIIRDGTDADSAQMRASILNYRRENGRTYHKLSDGKYAFPNDALEQERLDIVSHLWMLTFDGEFCLSPKKDGARRVLDMGTGTGVWALDYADEFPQATVIGVDLSPIQPIYVPPNCHFEVDDLEKEWTWREPFDFIFARNMIGCFSDWREVIAQAYKSLEPGGYFEIHDSEYPIKCDDGTLTDDMPLSRWTRMIRDACDKVGRSLSITHEFPQMMRDAGFEDVSVTKIMFPVSPWPDDPKLKEMGQWVQASLLPGLEGMSLALFTRVLEWSKAETIVFCSHVRQDVKNTNLHGYWDGYAIHGRKPLNSPRPETEVRDKGKMPETSK